VLVLLQLVTKSQKACRPRSDFKKNYLSRSGGRRSGLRLITLMCGSNGFQTPELDGKFSTVAASSVVSSMILLESVNSGDPFEAESL
jgi:hypothetical protein